MHFQEIQDILIEIKLQTPSITIGASYGDALMAMIGINHIRDFSEAKKLIETGKVYYPNLENTKKYGNIKLRGVFKKHAIKSRGGYN